MAKPNPAGDNLRLCKLTKWSSYPGYGFNLNKSDTVPCTISMVDSNSPAAAANLKINDAILEVNKKDTVKMKHADLVTLIQKARDNSNTIELLVMEKRFYDATVKSKEKIDRKKFKTFTAPTTMPPAYANLPKNEPRTCLLQRQSPTESLGFEIAAGENGTGAYINDVKANTPASAAGLRKSDRVIAIDDEMVETMPNSAIMQKLKAGKDNLSFKFYVMDTQTYKHYKDNGLSMQPTPAQHPTTTNPTGLGDGYDSDDDSRKPPTFPTKVPPRGTGGYGGGRDTTPPPSGFRPSDGISALPAGGLFGSTRPDVSSTGSRRRVLRLRPDPKQGYGFQVDSSGNGDSRHRVSNVTRGLPADIEGLEVDDCIVSVNDRRVTDMTGEQFKQFLRSEGDEAKAYGDPLRLEVLKSSSSAPVRSPSPTGSSKYRPGRASPPRQPAYGTDRASPPRQPAYGSGRNSPPRQPAYGSGRASPPRQPTYGTDRASPPRQPAYGTGRNSPPRQPAYGSGRASPPQQPAYGSGRASPPRQPAYGSGRASPPRKPQPSPSRKELSRGATDVISTTEFLRFYDIPVPSGHSLGIDVELVDLKHTITKVKKDSPAYHAGLQKDDRIVEVEKKNVEWKSHSDVMDALRGAVAKKSVRLLVAPSSTRTLPKRPENSQKVSGGPNNQNNASSSSSQNQPGGGESDRRTDQDTRQANALGYSKFEPTNPLPRKCVLKRDPNFKGCGFRVTDRPSYDTPIIVEVAPDSPAKRSGLSEGDHIIYVDSENVQYIGSFKTVTDAIQKRFEKNGQVELVTLTGPAFQVLKKKGGDLNAHIFDYESQENNPMQPRLYKLKFAAHEQDYGLTFRRQNMLLIKSVQPGSSAYALSIKEGDVVLELNGESTRYMSMNQVMDIIETSKQQGKLNILVIDEKGYQYSTIHAIPLNSMLPFVKKPKEQQKKNGDRTPQEPVYL